MSPINVASNLAAVNARIKQAEARADRPPGSVSLVAVSKTKPESLIREAAALGLVAFGENYAQEAVDKAESLAALDLEWHFIGPIQSNKTRPLSATMAWIHTLDREKIARRLSEQRPTDMPPLNVCIQVNVSGEASKSGLPPEAIGGLADVIATLPNLRLRGLMTIPAIAKDVDAQRRPFAALRAQLEQLKGDHPAMDTLSMGMSGDLEAAIIEGATHVRVGTDIFGAR